METYELVFRKSKLDEVGRITVFYIVKNISEEKYYFIVDKPKDKLFNSVVFNIDDDYTESDYEKPLSEILKNDNLIELDLDLWYYEELFYEIIDFINEFELKKLN